MTPRTFNSPISRRRFLRASTAAAAAVGAIAVVGCSDNRSSPTASPTLPAEPTSAPTQPPPTPIPTAPWSQVAATDPPPPRRDHSLTFNPDDGLIYIFGGRTGDAANNDLFTLDPAERAWRKIVTPRDAPAPRFGHNAWYDAHQKRMIIALGQGNDRTFFNDAWAYDANGWMQLTASGGDGPEIRYGAGSAFDRDANRLLISHGFTDQGRYNDTWSFDLATSSWNQIATSGDVPIKRCLTRAIWLPASQSMLLFAGQTDNNPFLGDMWKLDVTKGTWAEQFPAQLPSARNLYGAVLDASEKLWYVTGGNTPNGAIAETWSYDLSADNWMMLQPAVVPPARYSADAAIAGGSLHIFGGHNADSEINDTWALPLG